MHAVILPREALSFSGSGRNIPWSLTTSLVEPCQIGFWVAGAGSAADQGGT